MQSFPSSAIRRDAGEELHVNAPPAPREDRRQINPKAGAIFTHRFLAQLVEGGETLGATTSEVHFYFSKRTDWSVDGAAGAFLINNHRPVDVVLKDGDERKGGIL